MGKVTPLSGASSASPLSAPRPTRLAEEREEMRHRFLREQILSFIAQFRDRVGVEPLWQIEVELLCPQDDDGEEESRLSLPNASISWVRDSWRATLRIRCDLPHQQRRQETLHELVELSFHGTGELWYFMRDSLLQREEQYAASSGLPSTGGRDLWTYLDEEYRVRRNQEVEKVVRLFLAQEEER